MCCACDGGEQVDANGDPIDDGESEGEGSDEESGEGTETEGDESVSDESESDESEGDESGSDESASGESDDGSPSTESEGCPYVGYEENSCGRREWCEAECVLAGGKWEGPYETGRQTMKESCTTWEDGANEETLCDYRKVDSTGYDMGCD